MLAEGVFPDAYLTGTGKGAWRIPARNLADFRKSRSVPSRRGRRPALAFFSKEEGGVAGNLTP